MSQAYPSLLVRNVSVSGYTNALLDKGKAVVSNLIDEYGSGEDLLVNPAKTLFSNTPMKSKNLAMPATPEVPWPSTISGWTVVHDSGDGRKNALNLQKVMTCPLCSPPVIMVV